MNDPIVTLRCENCGKPCKAQMWYGDHLGSDCCGSYLLRRITDEEQEDLIADLSDDDDRTPAQRARAAWLDRS